jgi:hypothetical protein
MPSAEPLSVKQVGKREVGQHNTLLQLHNGQLVQRFRTAVIDHERLGTGQQPESPVRTTCLGSDLWLMLSCDANTVQV